MSRIGLVGGSYTSQSRNADDQLSLNWYPEAVESGSGKVASALYQTPGTKLFMTLPDTPVRGQILAPSDRAFAVAGSQFCEELANGTYQVWGTVPNDSKPVSMTCGPTQVLMASAGSAFVFDFSLGTLATSTLYAGGNSGAAATSLVSGGAGYQAGDTFLINAGDQNAAGTVDTVSSGAVVTYHLTSVGSAYLVAGSVSTITVTGGGSGLTLAVTAIGGGYAANDTGTVNGGTVLAQYQVLTVDLNGNVLTYSLTVAGAGYSVLGNVQTSTGGAQPGIGVGFAINVTGTGTANAFTPIPQQTLANVSQVGFCDGFFLALLQNSDTFLASNLEDATTWNPLSTASVSVFVGNVLSILVDHRSVWLFGSTKSVVYYNAGTFPFPFALIPGAFIEQGIVAPNSPVRLDNSVFWIGGDERGAGVAWRANGFTPVRVSTHAVEFAWQGYSTIADAVGYSYQDQGHSFWVIYFPTANKTWVYDCATSLWHERGYWNATSGIFTAHRSQNHIFAFGMHLVGDWQSGNVYQMSIGFYDDSGNPIRRLRRSPHIASEQKWIFHHQLQLDMETGLGPQPPLTGAGGSTSPSSIILEDSSTHLWAVTILDNGLLQTTSVPIGTPQTVYINDLAGLASWQLGVTTGGLLTTTSVTYNSSYTNSYAMATSGSDLQSAIQITGGLLQTNAPMASPRDPTIFLRWSDDGGHTWSNYYPAGAGQAGNFKTRVIWRRLGRSRDRVYEISTSDPIPWRLLEEDLLASPGFTSSERIVSQYRKVS